MSAITIGGDLIHYEKLGRGRPVILIHGWVGSWRYWIPLMQKLHLKFSVYTLDLIGFGDSTKDPNNYTVDAQVKMLEQFLDQLGIAKTAMVGHGLGALVAIRFAGKHPDKVARLMLSSLPLYNPGDLENRIPAGTSVKLTGNTRYSLSPSIEDATGGQYSDNTIATIDKTIASRGTNVGGDMTIASSSGSGVLNDSPTVRRPINIDREALRRAAEERDKPKRNHLMESFNDATMTGLLERCFKQSEVEYGKLKIDVEKSDSQVLAKSAMGYEAGAFLDEIRQLTAPVVAVHGVDDPIFTVPNEDIWNYLTLSKEDVFVPIPLPDVRHFPMLEHVAFPRLTSDFLTVPDISKLENS
ncbi:MAG: alpha/beta hydrolase [Anaerolineae bacterium]|nr:alpha/beta hydrolase [Anaerolineae bacterium]